MKRVLHYVALSALGSALFAGGALAGNNPIVWPCEQRDHTDTQPDADLLLLILWRMVDLGRGERDPPPSPAADCRRRFLVRPSSSSTAAVSVAPRLVHDADASLHHRSGPASPRRDPVGRNTGR